MTPLARAALLVLAISIAHALDHSLNQPSRDLTFEGNAVGILGLIAAAGTLWLARRREATAPIAAVATGFATAAGVAAIHLAPHWSAAFSDLFSEVDVNALSWAIVGALIASSLLLGVIGLRDLAASRERPSPA